MAEPPLQLRFLLFSRHAVWGFSYIQNRDTLNLAEVFFIPSQQYKYESGDLPNLIEFHTTYTYLQQMSTQITEPFHHSIFTARPSTAKTVRTTMPLPRLFQQGSNNTSLRNIRDAFGKLISERYQLGGQASAWLIRNGLRTLEWFKKHRVLDWLKRPRESDPTRNLYIMGTTTTDKFAGVRKMILAQVISFASVVVLLSSVGFSGVGIGGGQSFLSSTPRPYGFCYRRVWLTEPSSLRYPRCGFPILGLWRLHACGKPLRYFTIDGYDWDFDACDNWHCDCKCGVGCGAYVGDGRWS